METKNLDSPYFMDKLNTLDNVRKNTYTNLFKLQFSGASGNETFALPVADEANGSFVTKQGVSRRTPSE